MSTGVRRVVIGTDPQGLSFVASDGPLAPTPDSGFTTVWDGDRPPLLPSDGSPPAVSAAFFPPAGGFRAMVFKMSRDSTLTSPQTTEVERVASIRGALRMRDNDKPGMHQTDSVDIEYVLDGEIFLETDEREVLLKAGDWVVHNGTRHAWHNRTDHPCTLIAFFVGAEYQASAEL